VGQRLVAAVIPFFLSLFLGSLVFGVAGARVSGHWLLGLLLKGFFSAVVGGIAALCAGIAVQTLLGRRVRSKGLPAVLATFCPRCGQRSPAERVACPRCTHPFAGRTKRWSSAEHNYGATLLGLVLGGGLSFLGLFIAAGPFAEGERRVWMLLCAAALGLLLLVVGVLMIWGSALAGLDDLRGLERWSYKWSGGVGERETGAAEASALLRRGALLSASGHSAAEASILARDAGAEPFALGRLPRDGQSFVKALTVLYHAGLLGIWYSERIEWRLGSPNPGDEAAPSAVQQAPRTRARETLEVCLLERPPSQELLPLLQLVAPRITGAALPVSELWLALQAEQELMSEFDQFFRNQELVPELLQGRVSQALSRVISARLLN
jgi:hypothetical protein